MWLAAGPGLHYSNTWQLLINTPTTVIELFAAITIQFVGNKIQRQQESHERMMIDLLRHVQNKVDEVDDVVSAGAKR